MSPLPSASLFRRLQTTVETLHDVRLDLEVSAFLVDDATRQKLTPGLQLPEQLLVSQQDEVIELALFVHPAVIAALQQDDPHVRLHGANYEAYCIALEGVSHFVYVAWRAAAGWATRALELELQAEVDKFVASWLLLRRQDRQHPHLLRWLLWQCFGRFRLREAVPVAEHRRYWLASRHAARFCTGLVQEYGMGQVDDPQLQAILSQVRRFSRHDLQDKIA